MESRLALDILPAKLLSKDLLFVDCYRPNSIMENSTLNISALNNSVANGTLDISALNNSVENGTLNISALNNSVATTMSYRDLVSDLLVYRIATSLRFYWAPVIVVFGLPGNILAFLVMMKPHNRRIR